MLERFSLPQGVRDFPPDRAEEIRRVEECLLEEFIRWGYRRVITPFFESLDTISVGLGDDLKDKILKFVDPSTGDVVALRPDITPQVGRMVATQLREHAGPLRLSYNGRVIRYEEKGSGKEREIFQVGCELMGLPSPEADGEIIALAVRSLEKLGIKQLVLDIGHTGFLRFLLRKTGNVRKEIEEALKKKDHEALEKAISKASIPKTVKRVILSLPELYGSKDILSKAKKNSIIRKYVKELEEVLKVVDEFKVGCEINVDLGEIRGFNYYTGVTFELVSPRVPSPLIIGGRYDELIEKYGYKCAATGFAVDIESVLDVSSIYAEDNKNHFVVIPNKLSLRREAIRVAELLRAGGFKVILELKADANLRAMRIKESRSLNSSGVIFVETPRRLRLIESRTGLSKEFSNLEELLSSI